MLGRDKLRRGAHNLSGIEIFSIRRITCQDLKSYLNIVEKFKTI